MRILYLGPKRLTFIESFNKYNDEIFFSEEKITLIDIQSINVDMIICYGYRHIIKKDVINYLKEKIVNLHISYLPWNRGADPNFWSFIEDTPKGVTIHLIDEGIDTGKILFQEEVFISEEDTLKTSYEKLSVCIENLFISNWPSIRTGNFIAYDQDLKQGSIHYSNEINKYNDILTLGWDTPIKNLITKRGL